MSIHHLFALIFLVVGCVPTVMGPGVAVPASPQSHSVGLLSRSPIDANPPLTLSFAAPGGNLRLFAYPEQSLRVLLQVPIPSGPGKVGCEASRSDEVAALALFAELEHWAISGNWLEICGQRFVLNSRARAELLDFLEAFRMRALPMKEWPLRRPSHPIGALVASKR